MQNAKTKKTIQLQMFINCTAGYQVIKLQSSFMNFDISKQYTSLDSIIYAPYLTNFNIMIKIKCMDLINKYIA